jgi:ribonuclease HI
MARSKRASRDTATQDTATLAPDHIDLDIRVDLAVLFFDGSCEPRNPGGVATGGWSLQVQEEEQACKSLLVVEGGRLATNNYAEWCALGFGLRWLLDRQRIQIAQLHIRGDSKLVINQLLGSWQCNAPHLLPLRDRCRTILAQLKARGTEWCARWVPREENARADELSQQAYVSHTGEPYPDRHRRTFHSRA